MLHHDASACSPSPPTTFAPRPALPAIDGRQSVKVAEMSLTLNRRADALHLGACLLLASIACMATVGCQHGTVEGSVDESAAKKQVPRAIDVAEVRLVAWPRVVRVQGSLYGEEHAVVGAKVAGRVAEVEVDFGDQVEQGAVLTRLESELFDLQVAQAEAQLMQARASLGLMPGDDEAKLDPMKSPPVVQEAAMLEEARLGVERSRSLRRQGVNTVEELQQREAIHSVALARLNSALNATQEKIALLAVRRAELGQAVETQKEAVTVAPFKGVIQERHVAPGVYLQVGQPIVTLVRTDPLRFRAGVPEREALSVRVGQDIRLELEGESEPLVAQVARISPAIDLSSRSLMIEADIHNPDSRLRTGLFVEGEIVVAADEMVLAVAEASIMEFAGVEKVWLVRDGRSQECRVDTGRRHRGFIEIIGGLTAGDQIVANVEQGAAGPVIVKNAPADTGGGAGATIARDLALDAENNLSHEASGDRGEAGH